MFLASDVSVGAPAVTRKDFRKAFPQMGPDFPPKSVDAVYAHFDFEGGGAKGGGGGGAIEFKELDKFMRQSSSSAAAAGKGGSSKGGGGGPAPGSKAWTEQRKNLAVGAGKASLVARSAGGGSKAPRKL